MSLASWMAATFGSATAAALAWQVLKRFNPSDTAKRLKIVNAYTAGAAFNVLRLYRYFDRAVAVVKGSLNSCYRSPRINKEVGGQEPTPTAPRGSRHMRALACDLKPGAGVSLDQAMSLLHAAALRGELGPVVQLIKETAKGIVHVSWADFDEAAPLKVQLLEQPTLERKYIPYTLRAA